MDKKKNKLILGILILSSILLVTVGVSYSYLASRRLENLNKHPVIMEAGTTGDLKLVYTDCLDESKNCEGIQKDLKPGESVSKTFKITNNSPYDVKYTLYFQDIINSFQKDELVYELVSLDTEEVLISETPVPYYKYLNVDEEILKDVDIKAESTQNYKITVKFLEKDYDQSSNLDSEYYLSIGFLKSHRTKVTGLNQYARINTPEYSTPSHIDEGLYEAKDDYGISYYYRGNVTNNYVKYADMYFRIIRLNGNGTLRVIYDGKEPHKNTDSSLDRVVQSNVSYNTSSSDNKYLGYMYNDEVQETTSWNETIIKNKDSNIKTVLDNWYKENIVNKNQETYIADAVFCNELAISTGLGYGINETYYDGYSKLRADSNPTFKCSSQDHSYTKDDTVLGNAKLTYPVGLLTASEAMAAGLGAYNTGTTENYLYRGTWYWTMTPDSYENKNAFIYNVEGGNLAKLSAERIDSKGSVVPVINLSVDFVNNMTGDGTIENPYTIEETQE